MCGIAGYVLRSKRHAERALALFERLMTECQVRGRHASGVSWVAESGLRTLRRPVPAEGLLASSEWSQVRSSLPLAAVGHARYSTSGDWATANNNQPLEAGGVALVHNGLVSMGTKEEFEKAYAVRTRTENDSEVILRQVIRERGSLQKAMRRVYAVEPPIFALGLLSSVGEVRVVRDHLRPLWLFEVPELEMVGFASTEDIIRRALGPQARCAAAEPYEVYRLSAKGLSWESTLDDHTAPEVRWPRPQVEHPLMRKAKKPKELVWENPAQKQFDHRKHLRESFKQYCVAAISSWEIDPNYALMNYLFRRYELSKSQEYWACYLYGTFYHPGSVFYVMQEFPEYEKVDLGRLNRWHKENWRKLRYNTDRKYEKGHFAEMFESYRDLIGAQTPTAQEEFFIKLLHKDDPVGNFHRVTEQLRRLWHFGRYSVYIYTECLHRCMGMPMKADTIFLKEADSPRAGLCYVLSKSNWAKASLDKEQWNYLVREADVLMQEIQREHPGLGMDSWFMESCLCAYKGFFRPTKGRYLPYYLDRMYDEITQMEGELITNGVEWNVLKQFRRESIIPEYLGELAKPPRYAVTKQYEHVLRDEGRMVGLWPIQQRGLLK